MIHLLLELKNEVQRLRNRNQFLEAQVSIIELFKRLTLGNQECGTMGVDVLWMADKAIADLGRKEEQEKEASKSWPLPPCPACKSSERVELSPPESANRGRYFCPCNEPGSPGDSGHFDSNLHC